MNVEKQGVSFPSYTVVPNRHLADLITRGTGIDRVPDNVPPTYMIFLRGESVGVNLFEELDIPRQKALHGGQRYDWVRPVEWDDTLTVTARVASIVEKQGKSGRIWFADIEFAYDDSQGKRVLTEITRLIERE